MSKPHPAEGAEIHADCGFPGSCKVCCAVCTPLCAGRCAPCLCCSLFFGCRDFAFSNDHDIFLRNKPKKCVRAHSSTANDPCVPCLGRIQVARGSRYSTRILCSILLPFPEHVWRQFFHYLVLYFPLTPTTTTNY